MSTSPPAREPLPLRVRPARADEVEQLARLHSGAFPDERSRDARRRLFLGNARGTLEDLFVAERAGELCAHAFLFRAGIWLGGREVPCAAVASLGVAPAHRGRGVASALLSALHDEAVARGEPVSLLYPFKHGYYAAHGYGLAARVLLLRTRTRSLPAALPGAREMVPLAADDLPRLRALYAACCARTNGMLSRPERLWQAHLADESRHWAVLRGAGESAGALDAAVCYGFAGASDEVDGPTLRVHDHFARDPAGRASILAFLARQRDHCPAVEIPLAEGDPLPFALTEPGAPGARKLLGQMHPLGTLAAGAMLRVLSLAPALEARGYAGEGALDVEVVENSGARERVRLEVRAGRASVSPGGRGGALLRASAGTFAGLYTGALGVGAAVGAGLADVAGPDALRVAQDLFALPAPQTLDAF